MNKKPRTDGTIEEFNKKIDEMNELSKEIEKLRAEFLENNNDK